MTEIRIALVGDRGNHDEPAHPRIEELLAIQAVAFDWVPTTKSKPQTTYPVSTVSG